MPPVLDSQLNGRPLVAQMLQYGTSLNGWRCSHHRSPVPCAGRLASPRPPSNGGSSRSQTWPEMSWRRWAGVAVTGGPPSFQLTRPIYHLSHNLTIRTRDGFRFPCLDQDLPDLRISGVFHPAHPLILELASPPRRRGLSDKQSKARPCCRPHSQYPLSGLQYGR